MTERFTTLSSPPLHSGSVLRRYHEVKSPLFQLPLHHNNARFQYICRFQRVEVPTRFCGEEVMRGRRFYGGGSGFLLCFAAERKHCAPESLFQLPPPSHTLLREKVAVRPDFCTVWHYALRCFPPEAQWRAPGSSRQFSLTTYTFLRGGGYAWPEGLRRRVWISALFCGRKETLCDRKPVPIAAPVSQAFAGKGYCTT